MMIFKNKRRVGLAIAIGSGIVFGLYPSAVRATYNGGGNAALVLLAATWARALSMTFFCILTRKPIFQTKADIREAISGGFFQAISAFGIFEGMVFISGPLVSIIVFSHTLMLLFFIAWRGEIKLDATVILTTLAALVGLTLVLDVWHVQPGSYLIGISLAFMSAVATGSRLYIYGRQTQKKHPTIIGAENFLVAAIFTLAIIPFSTPHFPISGAGWLWLVVTCIILSAANFGMFYGIAYLGSFRWSLFSKLQPVFTALFSAYFVNEVLQIYQYLGIVIVLSSLAVYQITEHRRKTDIGPL